MEKIHNPIYFENFAIECAYLHNNASQELHGHCFTWNIICPSLHGSEAFAEKYHLMFVSHNR